MRPPYLAINSKNNYFHFTLTTARKLLFKLLQKQVRKEKRSQSRSENSPALVFMMCLR